MQGPFPFLKDCSSSLLHLVFPHLCEGCGNDNVQKEELVCFACLASLPETNFHLHGANPVEKLFWGRIPLRAAMAHYYFTKASLIQHLLHALKYKGKKELGTCLGRRMGTALVASNRFMSVEALIPLPLSGRRQKQRGYNQAALICEGISSVLNVPVWNDVVGRRSFSESQTKKSRVERWQNMEDRFILLNGERIKNRHVLLVDDVVTTGATLEACGAELIKASGATLSVATLCFSTH